MEMQRIGEEKLEKMRDQSESMLELFDRQRDMAESATIRRQYFYEGEFLVNRSESFFARWFFGRTYLSEPKEVTIDITN